MYDIENPDWCVTVYDNETDDVLGKLNLAALQHGLKSMHEIAPRHYDNLLKDNCDAITGDVFIQSCLFNEIVYG